MSTTVLSVVVLLLSQLLPIIGVNFGTEELEGGVQFVVAIATGLYIYFRRISKGDVNPLGVRK